MALLLNIQVFWDATLTGNQFLHMQDQAIHVLDCLVVGCLVLQTKELQSFQMSGTTHPTTGCHILQNLNELFPKSSHATQQPLCTAADTPCYVLFSDIFSPYLLPWALIRMNHQNQFLAPGRKIGCLNHGCHTPSLVVNNKEENCCILLCLEL